MESQEIQQSSVEQCLEYFKDHTFIGFDIETTGFKVFNSKVLSIQLGDTDNQYVIDTTTISIELFKPLLENPNITFIGHNLQFDLRFMLHKRIVIKRVWDTYVSEVILYNGKKDIRFGLGYVANRYTGASLNKGDRGLIHKEGFSFRVIRYCAGDVSELHLIKEGQRKEAYRLGCINALKLNNQFVPVIAYVAYCGIRLDPTVWRQKIQRDKEDLAGIKLKLDNYVLENNITKFIEAQLDLFSTERKVTINWKSPSQVVELFKLLDIDTTILDKETGEIKHSVSSKYLASKASSNEFIALFIKYGELYKQISTYGDNFFKHIEPSTGRIHTVFRQYINTGRMSSGGKNKSTKEEYINLLNIPSDELTRSAFIPNEGNVLIDSDYDAQEIRVFANFCMDEALLDMFDKGYTDMHSYTAWHVFPFIKEKYPTLDKEALKGIKKDFSHERFIAKTANFAINILL